jgi:hypothetical protein
MTVVGSTQTEERPETAAELPATARAARAAQAARPTIDVRLDFPPRALLAI